MALTQLSTLAFNSSPGLCSLSLKILKEESKGLRSSRGKKRRVNSLNVSQGRFCLNLEKIKQLIGERASACAGLQTHLPVFAQESQVLPPEKHFRHLESE